jgi:hypothetical protein
MHQIITGSAARHNSGVSHNFRADCSTDDRSELQHDSQASPGKIEYICRYFIMTFRTQILKKKIR